MDDNGFPPQTILQCMQLGKPSFMTLASLHQAFFGVCWHFLKEICRTLFPLCFYVPCWRKAQMIVQNMHHVNVPKWKKFLGEARELLDEFL